MNVQEFAELAAGYAFGALSDDDRVAFESALVAHPEWQTILDTDAATAVLLAETVAPVAPPLATRGLLLSQIVTLPQEGRAPASAPLAEEEPVIAPEPIVWPGPEIAAPVSTGLSDATAPFEPVVEDEIAVEDEVVVPPMPPMPAQAAEDAAAARASEAVVETPEAEVSEAEAPTTAVPAVDEPRTPGPATQLNELDPSLFETTPPTRPVEPPTTTAGMQAVTRRNWTRGLFTLAASLVVLTVLGFGAVTLNQWVNRPPAVVALADIESAPDGQAATVEVTGGTGVATAHWSESLQKAVLVVDGLPQVADSETFELWFVRGDGTPVSAGTFEAAGQTTTALLDGILQAGDVIAVTVEQEGGSETGAPTTEPIVAIPTA